MAVPAFNQQVHLMTAILILDPSSENQLFKTHIKKDTLKTIHKPFTFTFVFSFNFVWVWAIHYQNNNNCDNRRYKKIESCVQQS